MKKVLLLSLAGLIIFPGLVSGHAVDFENVEDVDAVDVFDRETAYFGEESDYLDYISSEEVISQGVLMGWWYPTYEEFLGN